MKTTTVIAGACKICYPPAPKLQTKLIKCKKFSYIYRLCIPDSIYSSLE